MVFNGDTRIKYEIDYQGLMTEVLDATISEAAEAFAKFNEDSGATLTVTHDTAGGIRRACLLSTAENRVEEIVERIVGRLPTSI